ncbi:LytTR family DNA-binding domain-containing protein [Frateuria defendens]|uniref:LytTR family DNA-binding domain-containing protein n=1 Tax=Frateuria defendens TaxID=2219559 RepID=UPI00066FCD6D|nr:LytTR family DNA-binding domain-containing protein [Frateuria defendens]
MDKPRDFYESFKPWRKPFEVGFWLIAIGLNTTFNIVVSLADHPRAQTWEPWVWEWTSTAVVLALLPAIQKAEQLWPLRWDSWRRHLPVHVAASLVFSVLHVTGMVLLRKAAYALAGGHYDFGNGWRQFGYEYLKDVRTYFFILGVIDLYRFWLLRLQGEARLLAEPDEGPPVEPIDRPERFLVRKLGKEFLVNAREVEWVQAAGNYVNLHVRGRDYPLRATMAGIEQRLDPARFVRVHRSYLVNLDYLAEIEPLDTGDARLTLRDGAQVPCSRRYRTPLRERFGEAGAPAA